MKTCDLPDTPTDEQIRTIRKLTHCIHMIAMTDPASVLIDLDDTAHCNLVALMISTKLDDDDWWDRIATEASKATAYDLEVPAVVRQGVFIAAQNGFLWSEPAHLTVVPDPKPETVHTFTTCVGDIVEDWPTDACDTPDGPTVTGTVEMTCVTWDGTERLTSGVMTVPVEESSWKHLWYGDCGFCDTQFTIDQNGNPQ